MPCVPLAARGAAGALQCEVSVVQLPCKELVGTVRLAQEGCPLGLSAQGVRSCTVCRGMWGSERLSLGEAVQPINPKNSCVRAFTRACTCIRFCCLCREVPPGCKRMVSFHLHLAAVAAEDQPHELVGNGPRAGRHAARDESTVSHIAILRSRATCSASHATLSVSHAAT